MTVKNGFKLKGSGIISFHLGCDLELDSDGRLYMAPQHYIERMVNKYGQIFGSKPKTNIMSSFEKNDHPEIDDSEFCDA